MGFTNDLSNLQVNKNFHVNKHAIVVAIRYMFFENLRSSYQTLGIFLGFRSPHSKCQHLCYYFSVVPLILKNPIDTVILQYDIRN